MLFSFCNDNAIENNQQEVQKENKDDYDSLITKYEFILKSGGGLSVEDRERIYRADTSNLSNEVYYLVSLMLKNKSQYALDKLYNILKKIPLDNIEQRADVMYSIGLGWSCLEKKDSLYVYLEKAINEDSLNVKYLYFRSKFYLGDSLYVLALNDLNKAIKMQPNYKGLLFARGIVKKEMRMYSEALKDMESIPSYLENDPNVYAHRAYVYLKIGKFKECIVDCDSSIKLNPYNGHEYGVRAAAKSKLEDFHGAYEDLKKAVQLGNNEAIPLYQEYKKYYETHKQI